MSIFKLLSLFYIPNISLYIIALRKNKKISIYKCYNKSSVQGGPCRSSFISNQIEGGGVGGRVTKLEPPNKYMPKFQCMSIYMYMYIQFCSSWIIYLYWGTWNQRRFPWISTNFYKNKMCLWNTRPPIMDQFQRRPRSQLRKIFWYQ